MPSRRARAARLPSAREPNQDVGAIAGSLPVLLQLQQVMIELIEAPLPECPLPGHPAFRRFERPGYKLVSAHAPKLSRADQSASLENVEMLHEGRQRDIEGARQLADRSGPGGESAQHRPTRRIGERAKDSVELGLLVSHMTNYIDYMTLRSMPNRKLL